MIAAVVCTCGGVVPMVRKEFKRAGLVDWLTIPVYEGKPGFRQFTEALDDRYKTVGFDILNTHVNNKGSYAVIIGYNEKEFRWADIKSGGLKDKLDAEIILQEFSC